MTERFRYREQTRRLAETSADLRSKEGVGGWGEGFWGGSGRRSEHQTVKATPPTSC